MKKGFFGVRCKKQSEESLKTGADRIEKSTEEIQPQAMGNSAPVEKVDITIELDATDALIANVITDKNGDFEFGGIEGSSNIRPILVPLPSKGTFVFVIKPSKQLTKKYNLDVSKRYQVRVKFDTGGEKNPIFQYTLYWIEPLIGAQTKGAFAISGKSDI